jgi:hypothetical protein
MNITTFCQSLFSNRPLTPAELEAHEVEFNKLEIAERDLLWQELNNYFSKVSFVEDEAHRYDYFRWYTRLSWFTLNDMDPQFIRDIAFPRQVVMAALLDFDPVNALLEYIDSKPFDAAASEGLYGDMLTEFMKSEAVVGKRKNQIVTLAQLIKEVEQINKKDDSLQFAEFLTGLKEILFSKGDILALNYTLADPEDAATRLVDIIQFCLGVKPPTISAVIQNTLHADIYQQILAANEQAERELAIPEERLSYREIQELIEQDLSNNPEIDLSAQAEMIVTKLNNLAELYQDAHIGELYYYNEQDGKFYWNEEMLKSQ